MSSELTFSGSARWRSLAFAPSAVVEFHDMIPVASRAIEIREPRSWEDFSKIASNRDVAFCFAYADIDAPLEALFGAPYEAP